MKKIVKFLPFGEKDIISLVKGLAIAMIGAGLTYLTAWIAKLDFGTWTPLIVAFWSFVANLVRKYLDGVKE